MKVRLQKLQEYLSKSKVSQQLYQTYLTAVLIPVIILGILLTSYIHNILTGYYHDLAISENTRIKTILFEITTQVYHLSEEINNDKNLLTILSANKKNIEKIKTNINDYTITNKSFYNYAEIEDVTIYTDNYLAYTKYNQIIPINKKIKETKWYQNALNHDEIFWFPIKTTDKYGNHYYHMSLVRKIPMIDSTHTAVMVIKISDNYLNSCIQNNQYTTFVSIDQNYISYSSDRSLYGSMPSIPIDYDTLYYQKNGKVKVRGKPCMASLSTMYLYQSDCRLYICILDKTAYAHIYRILALCMVLTAISLLAPIGIIYLFTSYFNHRIHTLRHVMHKASNDDYNLSTSLNGKDELYEVFSDLEVLLQKIKKKEAAIYQARIKEQELTNKQQKIEFKMLAAQINPHFLYNTLETIRMKAFTAGNQEVATATKLLGKTMRYVLENTGTAFTKLNRELDYVTNYIRIQKLRFEDKVNYKIKISSDIRPCDYPILPLLLQPIVENSILHGLKHIDNKGYIVITVKSRNYEHLIIQICDNGIGMTEETCNALVNRLHTPDLKLNSNIGLYNICQRIRLCYGEKYGLSFISRQNQGTLFTLTLPLNPTTPE
ncbi:sensor histidine kinase [Anaerosacchariphilus polymeriproducens]|uniref:Sensor histidine kinase n=1 Tax=Anaerosacchariphilus polymeriproducens TaxID=1812858 RepID=A0A371AW85_9FIRM|nr:histidine kinase [Anaerosacchariphilus polymeriproducens]RDU23802.1 sensor histidine kinase [Anaerosacchariphilus polymeriproducens]